jgi:hypothetical protein
VSPIIQKLASIERFIERFLLAVEHFLDVLVFRAELVKNFAHRASDNGG